MPFLLAVIKCIASSQFVIGICDRSQIAPIVGANLRRAEPRQYQPGPIDLPPKGFTRSKLPHNGQYGPSGQRVASKCFRAASSSVKIGFVRSAIALSYADHYRGVAVSSKTYNFPN